MDFAYFRTDDTIAAALAAELLTEGKTWQVDKRWSVRVDRTHHDLTKFHNHVQLNGRDVAVINQDGTPSHNSDLSKIPGWVRTWMRAKQLSEAAQANAEWDYVPAALITEAVRHEETMYLANEITKRSQ